ncbi:sensor histidine kinase [Bacillus paramycoides]|uniref:sensor histidine kinase n=1 Tax=Bacillus paramycoides TaxID=2026194 RepID=UPI003D001E19
MKTKWFNGIRIKLLVTFISSIFLAIGCIVIFQTFLLKQIGNKYGDITQLETRYSYIYFLIFFILTSVFFYIFSRKIIIRIEHINKSVEAIKEGNLDIHIPVAVNDEVGNLANNINSMVKSLKKSIERERRAEVMKNEMISNISHDLRTPITSLKGYIELIKSNIQEDVVCHTYVDVVQRKCNELEKQVNDLLEYCNIEFKEVKLTKDVIEVKELVQQVMIDFVPQLEDIGMRFHIESVKQKIYIEVDVSLIIRLLQNIISNSIFYGQTEKKMIIKILKDNSNVVIKIINYGKQIEPEDLPYIFERLYRAEKSRNAHTGGKGMGLAIAKSIAELHAGTITVHSNKIETAFIIILPEHRRES